MKLFTKRVPHPNYYRTAVLRFFYGGFAMTLETVAEKVIRWIGSTQSLMTHTFVFVVVAIILLMKLFPFEDVMLVFTVALSIEAIYLAIFIQIAVNRTSQTLSDIEQDIEDIQEE